MFCRSNPGFHRTRPKNENARQGAGASGDAWRWRHQYETVRLAVLGVFPGDARDVRAGDADIGKLTVAKTAQLMEAGVETAPGAQKTNNV